MVKMIDLAGQTFAELTVLRREPPNGRGVSWVCRCSCGKQVSVAGTHLRTGHTRSCGHLNALGSRREPIVDRFIRKTITTESGCIEYTGGTNGVGYGAFYVGKTEAGQTGRGYAHRFAYETFVGPIPEGLHLDHLCRNPICVNPDHLEPVTPRENLLRGIGPSAQHAKKSHCPAGHPYAGDNLYVHPTKGMRFCRACGRIAAQKKRDRLKAAKES